MKNVAIRYMGVLFLAVAFIIPGCGYTTQSLLPSHFKSIYVDNFQNDIKVTAEQSNLRMYRGYRPGMERDLTKAVINKFLYDGNLKIATEANSDLVLKSRLIDFQREALRYDANDNVEEYRIKLIVNITLYETKTGKELWKEKDFAGEATYRTGGSLAETENMALARAIEDLARRIVERTIEAW